MKKQILMILSLVLISTQVYAVRTAGCLGNQNGKRITFRGKLLRDLDKNSGTGTLTINGRDVADFDGRDLKINYFTQTFKVTNARGDVIEGRATSITRKTGIISRLYVPAHGLRLQQINMNCWTN